MSNYPKIIDDTLEIMVQHSDSYILSLKADCQQAFGFLDMTEITIKDIFLSVPIKFINPKINEENVVRITNPSNLPITFKWEETMRVDNEKVSFSPSNGIIPPKSSKDIKITATFFSIKDIDDLYKCFIDQMPLPIGVVLKGRVIGLDIKYELVDESFAKLFGNKNDNSSMSSVTSSLSKSKITRRRTQNIADNIDRTFKEIELKHIKVNKPYNFSFKIMNMSGIATQFSVNCPHFGVKSIKENELNSTLRSNNTTKSRLTFDKLSIVSNRRSDIINNVFTLNHFMLNDAHEEINFTSEKGSEFTKMRQIEKDSSLYLSNKKGIAIVVEPRMGKLDPYSEALVTVHIYNEMVGDFDEEIICDIKGLPAKSFPTKIRIRGNPLQLSPFQPGFIYDTDPPQLHLGHVLTGINQIDKVFKLLNTGSNTLSVSWKVFDYKDILNPKKDIFQIKIAENQNNNKFSLSYSAISPEEYPEDEKCFEIYPKECKINPKTTKDFVIVFKTHLEGLNSALIVGYPKFVGENSNVKLSELALKVNAHGVVPKLVVDKKKSLEDIYLYKFEYHSSGISPRPKRSIVLINKEKINIIIKIEIEGPFKIIKSEPIEASIGINHFNIIPNSNLKLEVKFIPPKVDNEEEWPMTLLNEKFGKMKVIFENNDCCEYFFKAILRRPRIKLYTTDNESTENFNFINFGKVNCENFRKHSIYLLNETEVETKWTLNFVKSIPKKVQGYGTVTKEEIEDIERTDDPDVFIFNITNGIISGPSLPLINIPLGPALPKVNVTKNSQFNPVKIDIIFKVKFY